MKDWSLVWYLIYNFVLIFKSFGTRESLKCFEMLELPTWAVSIRKKNKKTQTSEKRIRIFHLVLLQFMVIVGSIISCPTK
jgi:hypothetical protein